MPIVTLQPVIADDSERPGAAEIQALADRLGDLFGSDPGSTWIRVSCLPRSDYAENRVRLAVTTRPVFVEVLRRSLPDAAALDVEADRIAEAVAGALARPKENIHVIYLPPGEGRVAFGGRLSSAG